MKAAVSQAGRPPQTPSAAAELLQDFVNTYEPQVQKETWTSAGALDDWLTLRGLATGEPLSAADLTAAVTIREGLRALLLHNAGHNDDAAGLEGINRVLAGLPLRLTFSKDGYHFASAQPSALAHLTSHLLDAIRQCTEDGSWPRLKVCARDTCRWAFYDNSRNQVRRWCSMAGCGNHIKMKRAYTTRKAKSRGDQANDPK